MGAPARLAIYRDPNDAVAYLDRIGARRLVADEAGAGGEIEGPRVVGAGEVPAQDVALDERVALVRT